MEQQGLRAQLALLGLQARPAQLDPEQLDPLDRLGLRGQLVPREREPPEQLVQLGRRDRLGLLERMGPQAHKAPRALRGRLVPQVQPDRLDLRG